MQIQPYSRSETHPVPAPEARGPLAERTGSDGGNAYPGYSANGYQPSANGHVPHPAPGLQPSYLQVLIEHCKKRWKLLIVWLGLSVIVAYYMVQTYGKPLWRAEGSLYYSPNYNNRLYTPPNIQSVIALIKSPDILEKVRTEKRINATADQMQARLNINVQRQSEFISIQFDWPDKEEAAVIAARIQELALEQYELLRHKLSNQAIKDLDTSVIETDRNLFAAREKFNEALQKKGVFDLTTEKDSIIREIDSLKLQIDKARSEKIKLETKIRQTRAQIAAAEKADPTKNGLSEAQLNFLAAMRQIKERQVARQREVDQAKAQLKAKEQEYKQSLPLAQKGYITRQEMLKLESEIASLKVITEGSRDIQEDDKRLKEMEKQLLDSKQGPSSQARYKLDELEVELDAIPEEIKGLERYRDERQTRQRLLQNIEKEVMPQQQEINTLQQSLANLTLQKSEHARVQNNKQSELTIHNRATVGNAPVSTNNAKILVAVFGVAMLLFVGFVALRDMPRFAHAHAGIDTAEPAPLPALAKYGPEPLALPARRMPTPDVTSEQLRLLADRIGQSISGHGAIVLFTPAVHGLRIEALVADLGCFCAQRGGKVLVFDARPLPEHPNSPAWVGPAGSRVEPHLVAYLDGVSEGVDTCFTPTLIQAIDYTRCDLGKHLGSVMAMYRFRRFTHELRERYAVVLMITPERFRGGDGDFFTNVAEGIVVVLGEDANPADVESYIQRLRGGSTPVFGAVTVPQG